MLTLDVTISTYKPDGIKRVEKMLLPPKEGVKYIVSWQEHGNEKIPEALSNRRDVEVYRLDVKGLSNNRNNAIKYCNSDIILIADDDLEYEPDFAEKIIKAFEENDGMDLGIFKVEFSNPKPYPLKNCRLTLPYPKNYFCSSVEIAFRRKSLHGLKFWDKMGLGNDILGCGEDELFLLSAIKRGYDCEFINQTIGRHPAETTGDRVNGQILRGQGYIIRLLYPFTFPIRIGLKAMRMPPQNDIKFLKALFELGKGASLVKSKYGSIPDSSRW